MMMGLKGLNTYLRKLYCICPNNNWRCPQTVDGASSELSIVVAGSNGARCTADVSSGVFSTLEASFGVSSSDLLLWLASAGKSVLPVDIVGFASGSDVDKPFAAIKRKT